VHAAPDEKTLGAALGRKSFQGIDNFHEDSMNRLTDDVGACLQAILALQSSFAPFDKLKATEDRSRAPVGRSFMRRPKLAPTTGMTPAETPSRLFAAMQAYFGRHAA
jgi:hypothetical protein